MSDAWYSLHLPPDFPWPMLETFLKQHSIPYRIEPQTEGQRLSIEGREHAEKVQQYLLETFPPREQQGAKAFLRLHPLTVITIALGIVGWLLVEVFGGLVAAQWIGFPYSRETLVEFWRFLTPAFIHFAWWHILFNGLAILDLGGRLERYLKRWQYILLFFITAIAANVTQFVVSQSVGFGGLSGVAFGYVGFLLIARTQASDPRIQLPQGLFVLAMIMLGAGMLGAIDVLIPGSIANGAHLGGFAAGILFAIGYYWRTFDVKKLQHTFRGPR